VLALEAGDIVPADARVLAARGLRADESTLTGEAEPAGKSEQPVPAPTGLAGRSCGFQNSATTLDLGIYAAGSYSLRRPPRTARRLICFWERLATGWPGRGGRSWRLR
jgi:magnesium-transporting ATPase (P-type)